MKKTWISRRRRGARGTRSESRATAPRARRRLRAQRLARGVLVGVLVLALAPALPVLALRFVRPLGSALMVERWLEARAAGRPLQLHYDWVPLAHIAPSFRAAVVAAEDQRFYEHGGFDWSAMQDALHGWRRGRKLRGASTISQQLAKNLFLWPGRSVLRKGLEAWLTLWIEALWPKRRILEVYLNVVELGDGVFGAEAAARRYFGTSAARLSRSEASLLAAVLPSPRRSSVLHPSPRLRERQRWILEQI